MWWMWNGFCSWREKSWLWEKNIPRKVFHLWWLQATHWHPTVHKERWQALVWKMLWLRLCQGNFVLLFKVITPALAQAGGLWISAERISVDIIYFVPKVWLIPHPLKVPHHHHLKSTEQVWHLHNSQQSLDA